MEGPTFRVGPRPAGLKTGRSIHTVGLRAACFDKLSQFVLDTALNSSIIYILRASYPLSQLMGYDRRAGTRHSHDTH